VAPSGANPQSAYDEEFWRQFLEHGGDSWKRVGRQVFKRIPTDPRCRMCASPFGGAGGRMMRLIGKRPAEGNPNWCNSCIDFMSEHHGGATVEVAMLFADIRGSTSLAEKMSPADFHGLLDRFFATATKVVFDHDGFIDKFVGDELVAQFFPLLTGERFVAQAVAAAQNLLRATGHADPGGAWLPVGAGVHSGKAWVGVIGEGRHLEMTAVGDTVNTAARLASQAGAGEVLVSAYAAEASGLDPGLERRFLDLKGKENPTEVVSLRITGSGPR
jgi:adenylate cyclase